MRSSTILRISLCQRLGGMSILDVGVEAWECSREKWREFSGEGGNCEGCVEKFPRLTGKS